MMDPALQARFGYWRTSLTLLAQHPLGIGFNSLQEQYLGYYEHNLFLFLLDGTGPFGLIAFLWLWGWITSRCLHVIRFGADEARLIALAALLVSGFSEAWPIWSEVSWIILGSTVALSYRGLQMPQVESLVHDPAREGAE
jgi:hypothetical protein